MTTEQTNLLNTLRQRAQGWDRSRAALLQTLMGRTLAAEASRKGLLRAFETRASKVTNARSGFLSNLHGLITHPRYLPPIKNLDF